MPVNRLETEPMRRLFWSMALPVILQQLLLLLNNVIDRICKCKARLCRANRKYTLIYDKV